MLENITKTINITNAIIINNGSKMSHIERRQKEKEEMKLKILDAARKIASKEGWHAVTIRKIADEIEYTPPIVYEHFENKEDLIREIVYSGFGKLTKEFAEARQSETDSRKVIKLMSQVQWDFAFSNVELYQLMFSLERPHPSEEMIENMRLIEGTFLSLIKDKESLHEIIFSWMCLMTGAISIMMKFPNLPHRSGKSSRDIFISMINRFVEAL
jgi:AcrR family transcriptional regulator